MNAYTSVAHKAKVKNEKTRKISKKNSDEQRRVA